MIKLRKSERLLSRRERVVRVIAVLLIAGAAAAARVFEPAALAAWLPLPTSCGAVTGVPCIFCGMTRAVHYLLCGDFARALYFNWLAFPFVAALLLAFAVTVRQIAEGRKNVDLVVQVTPRLASVAFVSLFALWSLQVYLAVSGDKRELLNPQGPLYSWFVR